MSFHDRFFQHHPEPMWVYDVETLRFLDVNDAAIDHYGYSQAEFLGMTIADIRPGEEVERLRSSIAEHRAARNYAGVWRHLKKTGEMIHVRITTFETEHEGRRARIVSATDVTDLTLARQDAEASLVALRESRDAAERSMEWFRTLLNSLPAKLIVVSPGEHICLAASDAYLETFGFTREGIVNRSVFELFQDDEDEVTPPRVEMRQSLARVEESLERDLMTIQYYPLSSAPDAPAYWSASNLPVLNDNGALEFIIHQVEDVTELVRSNRQSGEGIELGDIVSEPHLLPAVLRSNELKTANLRLQEREANLRMAQRLLHIGIWRLDLTTMKLGWSENVYEMYGVPPDAFSHDFDGYVSLVHPDDRDEMQRGYVAFMESDDDVFEFEHRVIRSDGQTIHVRGTGEITQTSSGRVLTGVVRDITEEIRQNAQMKWLNACMSRINDIILITEAQPLDGPDGPKIVYANKAFERRTGYSIEEALGNTPRMLQGPDTRRAELDRIKTALENCQPVRAELVNYTKAGEPFTLELDIVPMDDETGSYTHWIAIERDVSARRALEDRLRQSERLESLGKLTGGIAHDFNNLLTVIMGNSEGLANALPEGRLKEMAKLSLSASQSSTELVSRLLSFARRQPLEPSNADLNARLEENRNLLQRTLPESIEIGLKRRPGCGRAMVDLTQFDTAILNLCLNARDAIDGTGRIMIETASVSLDDTFADLRPEVQAGDYVMVAVSDTGAGMNRETVEKAFEPFFTTKAPGLGTGLGLSMVYGFVRQSGGHVAIYSEPGHGTTVKMYFPQATSAMADPAADRPEEAPDLPSLKVLVVEDNEFVMAHVDRLMHDLGFEVFSARTGPEALDVLKAQPDIDLLFTDIVLPGGMDGVEIAEAARAVRPELAVLYTTGYTENTIVHDGRLDEGVTLLSKPYTRAELVSKIRQVMAWNGP